MIKKHIPNFITSLSLTSGLVSMYFVLIDNFLLALIMLLVASVFDFLDGAVARLLKVVSPMGKELDSLSDMVVFGLVPGLGLHMFVLIESGLTYPIALCETGWLTSLALIFPILIVVFSAMRLAMFNIDESQAYHFKGLPTPANALLIISLVYVFRGNQHWPLVTENFHLASILLSMFSAWILVSPVKLFSLKMKNLSFADNWYRYLLLSASLVFLLLFGLNSIPFIIIGFIVISVVINIMGVFDE